MSQTTVSQQQALKDLIQKKEQVVGMATRMRRSISYNESFDTNNQCNAVGLCCNLKGVVDAWEAEQLSRIAEEQYALNPEVQS